jgi:hypothetical protein
MSDNQRDTFRAKFVEPAGGILLIGSQKVPVCLTEESSGGLTITTDCSDLKVSADAELRTYEGRRIRVRIMHCEPFGANFQVGLQRLESADDCDDVAYSTPRISSSWYAALLILGLVVGCAAQTEAVQRHFAKVISWKLKTAAPSVTAK